MAGLRLRSIRVGNTGRTTLETPPSKAWNTSCRAKPRVLTRSAIGQGGLKPTARRAVAAPPCVVLCVAATARQGWRTGAMGTVECGRPKWVMSHGDGMSYGTA